MLLPTYGCYAVAVYTAFSRAVRKWLGSLVATFTLAVTMVQFHFLFYASKALPNTFALAIAVCVCVCACVRACVRVCVCVCMTTCANTMYVISILIHTHNV